MRKIVFFTVSLILLHFSPCPVKAHATYQEVRFTISDGTNNQELKERIEYGMSLLLTEINRAQESSQTALQLPNFIMTADAKQDITKLWRNEHFHCDVENITEHLLTIRDGYQVRGIPLAVTDTLGKEQLGRQEAVINFNSRGTITSFYYTINPELYSSLYKQWMQEKHHETTDIDDRMTVLNYVEHFRTAYNQKDLSFLQQVFSNDALIITGRVIKVRPSDMNPSGVDVRYIRQSKQEYLNNLKNRVFRNNSYIRVKFDDVTIVPHPTLRDIYGVTVHQRWNSSTYSDEGYVFMVWDFRQHDEPQIHVRTWQPEFLDKAHGQRLSRDAVFTLGDFDFGQ